MANKSLLRVFFIISTVCVILTTAQPRAEPVEGSPSTPAVAPASTANTKEPATGQGPAVANAGISMESGAIIAASRANEVAEEPSDVARERNADGPDSAKEGAANRSRADRPVAVGEAEIASSPAVADDRSVDTTFGDSQVPDLNDIANGIAAVDPLGAVEGAMAFDAVDGTEAFDAVDGTKAFDAVDGTEAFDAVDEAFGAPAGANTFIAGIGAVPLNLSDSADADSAFAVENSGADSEITGGESDFESATNGSVSADSINPSFRGSSRGVDSAGMLDMADLSSAVAAVPQSAEVSVDDVMEMARDSPPRTDDGALVIDSSSKAATGDSFPAPALTKVAETESAAAEGNPDKGTELKEMEAEPVVVATQDHNSAFGAPVNYRTILTLTAITILAIM